MEWLLYERFSLTDFNTGLKYATGMLLVDYITNENRLQWACFTFANDTGAVYYRLFCFKVVTTLSELPRFCSPLITVTSSLWNVFFHTSETSLMINLLCLQPVLWAERISISDVNQQRSIDVVQKDCTKPFKNALSRYSVSALAMCNSMAHGCQGFFVKHQ